MPVLRAAEEEVQCGDGGMRCVPCAGKLNLQEGICWHDQTHETIAQQSMSKVVDSRHGADT